MLYPCCFWRNFAYHVNLTQIDDMTDTCGWSDNSLDKDVETWALKDVANIWKEWRQIIIIFFLVKQKSLLFIFSSTAPQRTAYREVPSQMAAHPRTGSPL